MEKKKAKKNENNNNGFEIQYEKSVEEYKKPEKNKTKNNNEDNKDEIIKIIFNLHNRAQGEGGIEGLMTKLSEAGVNFPPNAAHKIKGKASDHTGHVISFFAKDVVIF